MTLTPPRGRAADGPWLRFDEIQVSKVESLENCLADLPDPSAALPLLALQATFDLSLMLTGSGPPDRRSQYTCAWQIGTCDAGAVARLTPRGLLLPYLMRWDGGPAVGFELCERMSPMRDATRMVGMRVRPLRSYLVLIADDTFALRGRGNCWQKVTVQGNAIRPHARQSMGSVRPNSIDPSP